MLPQLHPRFVSCRQSNHHASETQQMTTVLMSLQVEDYPTTAIPTYRSYFQQLAIEHSVSSCQQIQGTIILHTIRTRSYAKCYFRYCTHTSSSYRMNLRVRSLQDIGSRGQYRCVLFYDSDHRIRSLFMQTYTSKYNLLPYAPYLQFGKSILSTLRSDY